MLETKKNISNPVLDPDNYVQTRVPDVAELASLIKKAKGINRTMAEFAEACGVSASTFSRIANGKISQPLSIDILAEICIHADPEANIFIDSLTKANGMVSKQFLERKEKRGMDSGADEERFSLENQMKNIISTELLDRGLSVTYQKRIHVDENVPAIASGCGRGNLLIRIQGYEPQYWKFKTMAYIGVKRAIVGQPVEEGIDYECEADFMFHNEAEYFLLDSWEPDRLHKVRMAYVFPDRNIFEAFYNKVKKARVNNSISIILVDISLGKVIEERFLNRIDGTSEKSVFDLPVIEEEDEYLNLPGSINLYDGN